LDGGTGARDVNGGTGARDVEGGTGARDVDGGNGGRGAEDGNGGREADGGNGGRDADGRAVVVVNSLKMVGVAIFDGADVACDVAIGGGFFAREGFEDLGA
jgi:hypothetical protein